jgi:hypothetical protein
MMPDFSAELNWREDVMRRVLRENDPPVDIEAALQKMTEDFIASELLRAVVIEKRNRKEQSYARQS